MVPPLALLPPVVALDELEAVVDAGFVDAVLVAEFNAVVAASVVVVDAELLHSDMILIISCSLVSS